MLTVLVHAGAISTEGQPQRRTQQQQRTNKLWEVRTGHVHRRHPARGRRQQTREPRQQGKGQSPEQPTTSGTCPVGRECGEPRPGQAPEQRARDWTGQSSHVEGQPTGQPQQGTQCYREEAGTWSRLAPVFGNGGFGCSCRVGKRLCFRGAGSRLRPGWRGAQAAALVAEVERLDNVTREKTIR